MGGPGYTIPKQGSWIVKHGYQRQALDRGQNSRRSLFPILYTKLRGSKSSRIRLLTLKAKVQQICIDCLSHAMRLLGRH